VRTGRGASTGFEVAEGVAASLPLEDGLQGCLVVTGREAWFGQLKNGVPWAGLAAAEGGLYLLRGGRLEADAEARLDPPPDGILVLDEEKGRED
jgi:hypothetical protein